VQLVRFGASTLPVKVSFTTYGLTAGSSNYASTSGIIPFAAGVTSSNVTIPFSTTGSLTPPDNSPSNSSLPPRGLARDNLTSIVTIVDTNTPPELSASSRPPNGSFQAQLMCNIGLVVTVELDEPGQLAAPPHLYQCFTVTNHNRQQRPEICQHFLSRGGSMSNVLQKQASGEDNRSTYENH